MIDHFYFYVLSNGWQNLLHLFERPFEMIQHEFLTEWKTGHDLKRKARLATCFSLHSE